MKRTSPTAVARAWAQAAGRADATLGESLRLSDSHALRRVACDGHGVALFFAALVEDDLAQGRLAQPFPVKVHIGADYFLNYPAGELPRKARLFRGWLMDMLAEAQAGRTDATGL
ncbi:LysR substrate-binding domain-containing protein [Bosea sp. CCNWYY174]|uniref:LysR substrate-binding domain-containing protein n=1 Tax=Bosea sp. CCNWLY174 TaxID=3125795 RepID=UPI003014376B